jgi:hypothetical protein
MGPIAYYVTKQAKDNNSQKWQEVPEAGYCDACPEPPIVGSDWVAILQSDANGYFTVNHNGTGWEYVCFEMDVNPSREVCGIVWELEYWSGGGHAFIYEKGPCPGENQFMQRSTFYRITQYPDILYYAPFQFNNNEAYSQLVPGGVQHDAGEVSQGSTCGNRWAFWSTSPGQLRGRIKYVLYKGGYWP